MALAVPGNAGILARHRGYLVLEVRPTLTRPVAPAGRLARAAAALLLLAATLGVDQPSEAAGKTAPGAPPPAAAFGGLPDYTEVTLSPNGQRLAWIDNSQPKPRVGIFDVDARTLLRAIVRTEDLTPWRLTWSDDDTLLITYRTSTESGGDPDTLREFFITLAYDPRGGDGRMLPAANRWRRGAEAASSAYLVQAQTDKPHKVIMGSSVACSGGQSCLLEVDTSTGDSHLLKAGSAATVRWVLDRGGAPLAREDWDSLKGAYRVYALSGNDLREIVRRDDSDPPRLAGVLPDGTALVLLASDGRPHKAAWAVPLDGSPIRLLAEDPDEDLTGGYTDPHTGAIVGVYIGGSDSTIRWLDPQAQQRYDVVSRSFPSKQVLVYGWSVDGSRTLAAVESPSAPPVYYLIDFETRHADVVAAAYPRLLRAALGESRDITYQSRDGTKIPAYLTLPPGQGTGPHPLVVLPHDGPNWRDYPRFSWLVQFLATRGYAVLQPQFRGSTGFGEAFEKAGYREWGGVMQDDVTDGVRAMIDQGVADPRRVCIVGMSYGGYAALAGAAFTPSLYACAVSINGISDLRALMRSQVPQPVPLFATRRGQVYYFGRTRSAAASKFKERVGSETDPRLGTKSPINSVAAITIPVLIAYSLGVTAEDQSIPMVKALTKAGKSVAVVELPEEVAWLSRSDTRTLLLEALESFLKAHL